MVELKDNKDGRVALIMDKEELPFAVEALMRAGYRLMSPFEAEDGEPEEQEDEVPEAEADEPEEQEDEEPEAEADEPEEQEDEEPEADSEAEADEPEEDERRGPVRRRGSRTRRL